MGVFDIFRKKEIKESEEYAKLMKRISDLSMEVAKLDGRVSSLDVKIEAYRNEVKNVKKKAKEIADEILEEEKIEDTESNKYNDGFDTLRLGI